MENFELFKELLIFYSHYNRVINDPNYILEIEDILKKNMKICLNVLVELEEYEIIIKLMELKKQLEL